MLQACSCSCTESVNQSVTSGVVFSTRHLFNQPGFLFFLIMF